MKIVVCPSEGSLFELASLIGPKGKIQKQPYYHLIRAHLKKKRPTK